MIGGMVMHVLSKEGCSTKLNLCNTSPLLLASIECLDC